MGHGDLKTKTKEVFGIVHLLFLKVENKMPKNENGALCKYKNNLKK